MFDPSPAVFISEEGAKRAAAMFTAGSREAIDHTMIRPYNRRGERKGYVCLVKYEEKAFRRTLSNTDFERVCA